MPSISAVVAVVQQGQGLDAQFLSVARKDDPAKKGLPGGKVDPGETPEQALVRELLEETGLRAIDFRPVFDRVDEHDFRCQAYEVTRFEGEVQTEEAGLVEWMSYHRFIDPEESPFHLFNRDLFAKMGVHQFQTCNECNARSDDLSEDAPLVWACTRCLAISCDNCGSGGMCSSCDLDNMAGIDDDE